MKRRLQTLLGDAAVPSSFPLFLPPIAANHSSQVHRRNYAAAAAPRQSTTTAKAIPDTRLRTNPSEKRQQWLDSRGVRPANKPAKKEVDQDFVVRKHLQYLKDPLKLAEHVRRCLREGDIDTTLGIVRAASKSIECTVSWNHLIEWHLSQGKIRGALRIYNEV
jgi:pentatricopeptide repeat protein